MNKRANQRTKRNEPSTAEGAEPLIPERIARFLARIPTTTDCVEWQEEFSWALHELCGDIDIVGLSVSLDGLRKISDLNDYVRTAHNGIPGKRFGRMRIWTNRNGDYVDCVLDELACTGIPVEEAHSPTCFEYRDDENRYLATLVLLRHRSKSPISARTLAAMEAMRPFLCALFVSFNRRRAVARPLERLRQEIINDIVNDLDIPDSCGVVLTLQMFGCMHREMAEILHISEYAVAERIRRLYRLAGCHSAMELFGRYLQRRQERAGEEGPSESEGNGVIVVM